MDKAEVYNSLDMKTQYGKKHMPYTLIWTKDRLIVIEVTAQRKEIVGSFNVSFGGASDSHIVSVV